MRSHHAYQQQPAVELTCEGQAWLNERLERTFEEQGQMEPATLQGLDWPMAEVAREIEAVRMLAPTCHIERVGQLMEIGDGECRRL
jgi:hypothetical protein